MHVEHHQKRSQKTWKTASLHTDLASHTSERGAAKQMVDERTQVYQNPYTRIFSWDGIKDAFNAFTDKSCLNLDVFDDNSHCHYAMPLWSIVVLIVIGVCCCCLGCC